MIRSVLTLRTAAGKAQALEDFFVEQTILERARTFTGCLEAVLLRSIDGTGSTHLVTADWDSEEDYRRWVEDPWRVVVSQQLASLMDAGADEPIVGRLFLFV